jgi:5'-deoxynucleotidase YfbR-like HD superfamily hydrolase
MKNFKRVLAFEKLLQQFNAVYRGVVSIHDPKRPDNDVEHSYRVAMLCWMIVEEYQLKYSISKVLKYALLHDFTEVYAGDKSMYSDYSQKDKERAERQSLLKLQRQFPKMKSLWNIISTYEKRDDAEAKFVYVIEKLEPIFLVLLVEQDHFKKRGITLEDFIDLKQRKIKDLDTIAQLFNKEVMAYLKKNKKKYFN